MKINSHLLHRVSNLRPEFINNLIQFGQSKLLEDNARLIQEGNHSD